jgi:ferric-dicitrate binding protein FerR (iron transport regulator)
MGQAKQRGTFEQRSLESQHAEALRMEARRVQIEARKEAERQRRAVIPPPARRRGGIGSTVLLSAIAMGLGACMSAQPTPTKGNGTDKGEGDAGS